MLQIGSFGHSAQKRVVSARQLVWFVVCEEGWDLCEKCSDNQITIPQLSSLCQFLFLLMESDRLFGVGERTGY